MTTIRVSAGPCSRRIDENSEGLDVDIAKWLRSICHDIKVGERSRTFGGGRTGYIHLETTCRVVWTYIKNQGEDELQTMQGYDVYVRQQKNAGLILIQPVRLIHGARRPEGRRSRRAGVQQP